MNKKTVAAIIALSMVPATLSFAAPSAANSPGASTVANLVKIEKGSTPNAPFQFSARAGLGLVNGEVNEYVYLSELKNYKLSQLTWDINNVLMGNLGASLEYNKWLLINADVWFGLTEGSGEMVDYDWQFTGADWSDYSKSDVDVTSANIIDINANVVFFRSMNTALSGIIGFKRDNFEFDAKGGTFIYSSGAGYRDVRGNLPSDVVVSYDQTLTSGYLGIGFSTSFSQNLELSGRFIYSPFVHGEATDHHYLRNLVIEDDGGNDGDMYAFDLSLAWYFSRHLSLDLSFSYQSYDDLQDDSTYYYKDSGRVLVLNNGAGMDQKLTMFSTDLSYAF